jgi:hypothetical protein
MLTHPAMRRDGMRYLSYGVLMGVLLAAPAAAQSATANDGKPAQSSSQNQAGKDSKAQAAKNGGPAADPASQAAAPAAKDDSLTTYDVTGSNASNAMGAAAP